MDIEEISPKEAYQRMLKGAIYLDVRTKEEFAEAHAKNAINIPIKNKSSNGMVLNITFIDEVEKNIDSETNLVIGCRTGGRSMEACLKLAQIGYNNIANIKGGFIGTGDVLGWSSLDLPIEK